MVKPVLGTEVHGGFNEIKFTRLFISVIEIRLIKYESFIEVVRGMCFI